MLTRLMQEGRGLGREDCQAQKGQYFDSHHDRRLAAEQSEAARSSHALKEYCRRET